MISLMLLIIGWDIISSFIIIYIKQLCRELRFSVLEIEKMQFG